MARLAMLIDLTRCIGCDACTVACKQENGTPQDVFFARVLNVEQGAYPNVKRVYIPVLCNHCENPACLKACPNKAIFRRDDGIVLIDQDRCRGTGACVSACPYGNIILSDREDRWYLPDDRPYERDYVRPRLNAGVARKCTLCAHRVDEGLEPACVVACPTTARIFGDKDDPGSKISRYIAEQEAQTGRTPFQLVPEAGTDPANVYLATMAQQQSSTLGGAAEPLIAAQRMPEEPAAGLEPLGSGTGRRDDRQPAGVGLKALVAAGLLLLSLGGARAQTAPASAASVETPEEVWSSTACAGCHGANAHGGFGPPLAGTTLSYTKFLNLVRGGKGMMPATSPAELPDGELRTLYDHVHGMKLDPSLVPFSYKVAGLFSTHNVGIAFAFIGLLSVLLSLKVLAYWLHAAGWRELRPRIARMGWGRALGIAVKALIVDGLLVASLWKKSRFRWAMHGLLLYGFLALGLADILMSIFNPTRGSLPHSHPLKLLPNLGGVAVLIGIVYVRIRYKRDEYIDNGLTLGRDYLFLNLLTITILTGFLTQDLGALGAIQWVLPLYMLHLATVAVLLVSAPFTRFSHVFLVPVLVALTKITQAVAESGVDLGFCNEPSPGRHHKSERIAASVLQSIDPNTKAPFRLRYYP